MVRVKSGERAIFNCTGVYDRLTRLDSFPPSDLTHQSRLRIRTLTYSVCECSLKMPPKNKAKKGKKGADDDEQWLVSFSIINLSVSRLCFAI